MNVDTSNAGVLEDEATPMSLTDILNQVIAMDEIILTIPANEEASLRTGLAGVKAKQNAKLKSAGLQPDSSTLSYVVTKHKELPDVVDVHITLSKKATVTVLRMRLPDDEI